jgi:hypothetical protein
MRLAWSAPKAMATVNVAGWSVAQAALRFQVSWGTANRWVIRFRCRRVARHAAGLVRCLDDGYVVQRGVVGRREPVLDPRTGRVEDWVAVWDVFLTPDGSSA